MKTSRRKLHIISILSLVLSFTFLSFSFYKKDRINVYIVGDSTVKNGKGDGGGGLWGWGDPIAYHFDSTKVNVENHALGGTSSRTFQTRGLWQSVLDKVKPGDYVLIQFGHNDGGSFNKGRARASIKGIGDDTTHVILEKTGKMEVVYTYGWYMRKYINDTKAKGGIPIIISSIPRNVWKDGKIEQNPKSYPFWAKQVAKAENVPFIDLSKLMIDKLEQCNESVVTGMYFFKKDHTHTNARGAVLNAHIVASELKKLKNQKLSKYVIENPVYTFPGKIKLLIIGDSTVARGKDGIRGWGAEISAFFDTTKIDIINRARGGRSSRTFTYEGLWKEALEIASPGDFLLIQFGHNDGGDIEKGKMRGSIKGTSGDSILVTRENNETEVVHSYGWYLKKYITEAQKKGVVPIVLSQIPRREWIDGKVERVNKNYGKWARETAEKYGAYFIDLNEVVAQKYEVLGPKKVAADYFLKDHTHTTKAGAILNAETVAEEIQKLNCCELKKLIEKQ